MQDRQNGNSGTAQAALLNKIFKLKNIMGNLHEPDTSSNTDLPRSKT